MEKSQNNVVMEVIMNNRYDMKFEGVGKINGGFYKNIIIEGTGKFLDDVDAEDINTEGCCKALGNIKCRNFSAEGTFKSSNSIVANEKINLEGIGKIHGDLESKDIQIEGAVKVNGLVSADNIRIEFGGNSYVNEIGGEKITIEKSKNSGFKFWSNSRIIVINTIEGDEIYLENTKCNIVRGSKIIIGENCSIEKIEYSDEIKIDCNSQVKNVEKRGM